MLQRVIMFLCETDTHACTDAHIPALYIFTVGRVPQSVQRLATGWTVRGSNPGGGEIFRTFPDRPWGPPSLLYNGYRVFPGGKKRPGRDADHSPPSSAVVMKETPTGRTACNEPQCLYKGAIYPFLNIFTPVKNHLKIISA
jgi:hypothetical protein